MKYFLITAMLLLSACNTVTGAAEDTVSVVTAPF